MRSSNGQRHPIISLNKTKTKRIPISQFGGYKGKKYPEIGMGKDKAKEIQLRMDFIKSSKGQRNPKAKNNPERTQARRSESRANYRAEKKKRKESLPNLGATKFTSEGETKRIFWVDRSNAHKVVEEPEAFDYRFAFNTPMRTRKCDPKTVYQVLGLFPRGRNGRKRPQPLPEEEEEEGTKTKDYKPEKKRRKLNGVVLLNQQKDKRSHRKSKDEKNKAHKIEKKRKKKAKKRKRKEHRKKQKKEEERKKEKKKAKKSKKKEERKKKSAGKEEKKRSNWLDQVSSLPDTLIKILFSLTPHTYRSMK